MASSTKGQPFAAVGFLSMAANSLRRQYVRQGIAATSTTSVASRFLIARSSEGSLPDEVLREAVEQGDVAWLNMSEGSTRCSLKYLLWMEMAPKLFPGIKFVVFADDDVFVQLAHLHADLQLVHGRSDAPQGDRFILYGLVMWRAYYNRVLMLPNTGFQGWDFTDKRAVAQRRTMDRCKAEIDASRPLQRQGDDSSERAMKLVRDGRHPYCARLQLMHVRAILAGQVDTIAPFPMVNGPCFAVSTALANTLVADHLPSQWLSNLTQTPTASLRLFGYPCWPVGDSIVGLWVSKVALKHALPLELVNTPLMRQHSPWPRWRKDRTVAFGNYSIVLHGLKGPSHAGILNASILASAGAFEPIERVCGGCGKMAWSSYVSNSSSALSIRSWTCCGSQMRPGWLLGACQSGRKNRRCPKVVYFWDEMQAYCMQAPKQFKRCVRSMVGAGKLRREDVPSGILSSES
jgi:hypothetical protein